MKSKSKTYTAWNNMKKRCNQVKNYPRHGGRGITYTKKWETFQGFLEDMGECPSPSHTLDRINNDGNYEPNNVRWTTYEVQNRNRCIRRDNSLGIVGVQPYKNGFIVTNTKKQPSKYIGWSKDFFDACCLRKSSELLYD